MSLDRINLGVKCPPSVIGLVTTSPGMQQSMIDQHNANQAGKPVEPEPRGTIIHTMPWEKATPDLKDRKYNI